MSGKTSSRLALLMLLGCTLQAQPASVHVVDLEGAVSLLGAGGENRSLEPGMALAAGERLLAGWDGWLLLAIPGSGQLMVGPESDLKLQGVEPGRLILELARGILEVQGNRGAGLRVITPTLSVFLSRAGVYSVRVEGNGKSVVKVAAGVALTEYAGNTFRLEAGDTFLGNPRSGYPLSARAAGLAEPGFATGGYPDTGYGSSIGAAGLPFWLYPGYLGSFAGGSSRGFGRLGRHRGSFGKPKGRPLVRFWGVSRNYRQHLRIWIDRMQGRIPGLLFCAPRPRGRPGSPGLRPRERGRAGRQGSFRPPARPSIPGFGSPRLPVRGPSSGSIGRTRTARPSVARPRARVSSRAVHRSRPSGHRLTSISRAVRRPH